MLRNPEYNQENNHELQIRVSKLWVGWWMTAGRKAPVQEQDVLFNLLIQGLDEEPQNRPIKGASSTRLTQRECMWELDFQKAPCAEAVSQILQGEI